MAKGDEEKPKKDTKVVDATISIVSLNRLEALVCEGAYGITRPEVIRHFIEAGLREARKDGHITEKEWAAAMRPATNIPSKPAIPDD
jgi:hypothetical protein